MTTIQLLPTPDTATAIPAFSTSAKEAFGNFLRPIPADIESPEKKYPILSPGSEIIQRPSRLNITIASGIMLFNPSDIILRGVCFWHFHQKVGQKIIRQWLRMKSLE